MCRFKNNLFGSDQSQRAFTMVEVVAALMLLSMILGSVMVLMNRYVTSVADLHIRQEAFELARRNMEQLLAENKLSDMAEFGDSENNPDIEWQTLVEPFYEPVTDQMWIRAVCSAGYYDTGGEFQNIEIEHWITNLTAEQVKQILAQQQVEAEYLELLAGGEDSAIQETTLAYLEQEGLDAEAYRRFIEQQKRQKLEYITEKGFEGYEEFLEELSAEENRFLEELGMDFDGYNGFAANYVPQNTDLFDYDNASGSENSEQGQDQTDDPDSPKPQESSSPEFDEYGIDWGRIPPELIPIIEQLLGTSRPD